MLVPKATTVKPISLFLPKWRTLAATIASGQRLVIVGGGAGGVELALAARATLPAGVHIDLVGQALMPGHGVAARRQIERVLKERSIGWSAGRVSSESADGVRLDDGRDIQADEVLWVTNVAAPGWLGEAGLAVPQLEGVKNRHKVANNEQGLNKIMTVSFRDDSQHTLTMPHPRNTSRLDLIETRIA